MIWTPSVHTCQIMWGFGLGACSHILSRRPSSFCVCVCVFAWVCVCGRSAGERLRMQCALRWVCLHLSCWSVLSLFVFETDDLLRSPRSACYSASFISSWSDRRPAPGVYLGMFVCWRGCVKGKFGLSCVLPCAGLAHKTIYVLCVCAHLWGCDGKFRAVYRSRRFWSMLSREMESGKCSSVKALPCWIQRRGDTKTPIAKWCRSSLCLWSLWDLYRHTHKGTHRHFGKRWQVLCRG